LRINPSIIDRKQERSRGLVVESEAHQRQGQDDFDAMLQAPAKQLAIARWQEKTGNDGELGRSPDERLQVAIASCDRVAREADHGCISTDPISRSTTVAIPCSIASSSTAPRS